MLPIMLIDSHCHLNFKDFNHDLEQVISRAQQACVGMMLSISTRLDEAEPIAQIAQNHPDIVYSVGVHPHEVGHYPELNADQLVEMAKKPKLVGLGETGLDFYRNREHEALQKQLFRAHIEAARQTGLPVIIHCRAADQEMTQILNEEMEKGSFLALMHCFTASAELAQTALKLGLYISFSGILTFKNAENIRKIAQTIPNERLLLETDAPYLAPEPHRGKRNEPAFISHTASKLAELKSLSYNALVKITGDNFFRLFSKAQQYKADKAL